MKPLICSLPTETLAGYLARQLDTFFPDGRADGRALTGAVEDGLDRLGRCLAGCRWHNRRAAAPEGPPRFDHLHSDQYALFLLLVARALRDAGAPGWLADKVYYLNKALHGLDIYHAVRLPVVFQVVHAVGTVVGRAELSDYLMLYQNVTIGGNHRLNYPHLGRGVVIYGHARVIGASTIGDNCLIGNGALLIDTTVPPNSVVSGSSPQLEIRPYLGSVIERYFGGTA